MEKRNGLLILGMHRSGTSALTRVLSLLGYELPKNVTGSSEGNERGHWESALIAEVNDEIFQEQGIVWFSWSLIELERLNSKRKVQIIEDFSDKISIEFPKAVDFVLKDPRACRTASFILKAFNNNNITPKIIIPIRNPLEVADSLNARDNISKEQSAMIWLRYTLDAEFSSRGHSRVFTFFDELLKAPEDTLKHITSTLKIRPPVSLKIAIKDIDRFLNNQLKHHSYYRDDVMFDSAMRGWVSRAYFAFLKLGDNPNAQEAMQELDIVRNEVDSATPLFETILNTSYSEQQKIIKQKISEADKVQQSAWSLQQEVNKKCEIYEVLLGEKEELLITLKETNENLKKKEKAVKAALKEKRSLRLEVGNLIGKVSERDEILNKLNGVVSELQRTTKTYASDLDSERIRTANLQAEIHSISNAYKRQAQEHEQTILDYQAKYTEVQHLRELLAQEQRTVLKPAYRRIRNMIGTALRFFLPDSFVERLAFCVPTSEQKLIIEMKQREENTSHASYDAIENSKLENQKAKPDIFIFAIIGWHFRTQRPQHIARELSRLGHRVFYFEMDPPGASTEVEKIDDQLYRIKLKLDGTEQIPAYVGIPSLEQEKAWLRAFYTFCDEFNASPHKNLIIQHPFWWRLARLLSPEFYTLYDCMDDISGFSNTSQALIDLEHDFLKGSDKLIVSATTLMNKYKSYDPLKIIRNATELEPFFKPDSSKLTPKFTAKVLTRTSMPKIKIGYVGAIADWFDTELIRKVARSRPDIEFHLCGNVSADHPNTLKREPNIHMYGEIPYVQVPAFLDQMHLVTIPFKIIPIIQACDPVKFYEYSALGKPTITTPLPELSRANHLVFIAKNAEEFIEQIDKAYSKKDDKNFIKELQDFAAENTWKHRAEQFYDAINNYPKVSVIILAYGNPELTNVTLKSLKGKGDIYPNMEIIIVDNGSSDVDIKTMKDYADRFSDIKLIENGENLGFAAGNNVGMKAASGEYVLLLNNDTFVSPGSIQAMLQNLKNDPSIGAVGPLTNNIGNEAKLSVNYASMDEMITKSRALKTGFRGKNFETRVVAYFAVMFRKKDIKNFGLISTDYGRGMFEDDDHCNVIRSKGYKCVVAEDAFVHHHLSATFSKIDEQERKKLFETNKKIYETKWGAWQPHKYRSERLASELQFPNEDLF